MENDISFEYLYTINHYVTFNIVANSRGFSGNAHFCIAKDQLGTAIKKLYVIYDQLEGTCTLYDNDCDDYVTVTAQNYGKIVISGQLGGSDTDQFLKFELITDQIKLHEMIKDLETMVLK